MSFSACIMCCFELEIIIRVILLNEISSYGGSILQQLGISMNSGRHICVLEVKFQKQILVSYVGSSMNVV